MRTSCVPFLVRSNSTISCKYLVDSGPLENSILKERSIRGWPGSSTGAALFTSENGNMNSHGELEWRHCGIWCHKSKMSVRLSFCMLRPASHELFSTRKRLNPLISASRSTPNSFQSWHLYMSYLKMCHKKHYVHSVDPGRSASSTKHRRPTDGKCVSTASRRLGCLLVGQMEIGSSRCKSLPEASAQRWALLWRERFDSQRLHNRHQDSSCPHSPEENHGLMWWYNEIGLPPVIIHFRLGFSMK